MQPSRLPLIFGVAVFIILFGATFFFYSRYRRSQETLSKLSKEPKYETRFLLNMVGKLIELPEDEEPTVATVTEKEKLPKQPFYKKAENGDKILIYTVARKAILYRPRLNKIIEVGPVNIVPTETVKRPATSSGRIIFNPITATPSAAQSAPSAN